MLKARVITALCLVLPLLGALFFLPTSWFALVMIIPVLLGAWEWTNIMGLQKNAAKLLYCGLFLAGLGAQYLFQSPLLLILSFAWWVWVVFLVRVYPGHAQLWKRSIPLALAGWVILMPAWWGMVFIHQQELGANWLLYAFLLAWGADTSAYFAGRRWGQRKLAPEVSPGKTIEGLLAALVLTAGFSLLVAMQLHDMSGPKVVGFLLVSLLTVAASVYGDLAESMFKRLRGVKDSSNLLPGHGGVLDRIDSGTAAVPIFAFGMLLIGGFN